MASVVVKTIWQSKEIHEAGDPPAGAENRTPLGPEVPGAGSGPGKGITKKKKAVSFHGVEPRMSHEPMQWCLNLKRSSACTNVSLLNLAAVEPPDSSRIESTAEELPALPASGTPSPPALSLPSSAPTWAPDDPDIADLLNGVNSGLLRAKDSITSLKEKTTRVNQHVQSLQSECSVLSENLERRRQEAEELEGYCSQLKENCRKVTRSVEDAEIKTNVLKQNSALLEEKLRFLQQQLQDEPPRRQEAEQLELEQQMETGLSRHSMVSSCPTPGPEETLAQAEPESQLQPEPQLHPEPELEPGAVLVSGPTAMLLMGSPPEPPGPRATAVPAEGSEAQSEGQNQGRPGDSGELELQKVTAGLEELRREVSSLTARWYQEEGAVQEALRLLGGLGGRLDGFLGQWERAQREQAQTARGLQELRGRADELCTMVERSAVSVASLRGELEGLGPVKPVLEELGRQLGSARRGSELSMTLDRPGSCTRCGSQGQQLSSESLQQLLERALTPLVDEVKQRGLAPACPSCQRLHKKILELERQALAKHVRAEALSSTLRLAQDEALRAKNLLLTDKMKPEEKVAALDYLHLKMCSLHDQLSSLPLEGSATSLGGGSSGGAPPKRGGPAPEQ
ncbi:testis-specific serine kinase substrate isoform X1 [Sarcophilus harrisii]|uniref:Testis specific serine kinase substrate n=1 Tax=Sarcophilus harrisii TaxID=9305 RepID=A0A7N4V228_SARHA|nr:testis-specific serine kinase substrate isoform X1 [Sarcophilus harrisii]